MGMSCASCSARVEKTLNRQPGVRKATVNYASATATVEYDSQNCSPEALQQAVQNAGYDLLIKQDENTPDKVEQAHDKISRAEIPRHMGHRLVRARYGYRHVLYGYAVR